MPVFAAACASIEDLATELTRLTDQELLELIARLDSKVSDLDWTQKVHAYLGKVIEIETQAQDRLARQPAGI